MQRYVAISSLGSAMPREAFISTHLLLPPHPHVRLFSTAFIQPGLDFPNVEPVASTVRLAGVKIKRPFVLGTGNSRAQHDAEILNVEWCAIGQRVR
jgi:hypothetical protein